MEWQRAEGSGSKTTRELVEKKRGHQLETVPFLNPELGDPNTFITARAKMQAVESEDYFFFFFRVQILLSSQVGVRCSLKVYAVSSVDKSRHSACLCHTQ